VGVKVHLRAESVNEVAGTAGSADVIGCEWGKSRKRHAGKSAERLSTGVRSFVFRGFAEADRKIEENRKPAVDTPG